jgi:predicted nucleic acid-binding protein
LVIYLDTSALLKLYIREKGSEFVQTQVMSQDLPLPIWELQLAEFINALRLKTFWGEIDNDQADGLLALFDERMERGQYYVPEIDRDRLMTTFRALSRETERIGCRTMDVYHVACAVQLGPQHFISFDERQRTLATSAGLNVVSVR